jgi:sulfatase maturation enzyme AslB (radical SAM superfamily)
MHNEIKAPRGIALQTLDDARDKHWYFTHSGEPRGYIDAQKLQELWIHTGTACNLACPFCLEGSKPGDDRLNVVKFEDVQPYIDEAVDLGVERFSFTGGEPFVARDLIQILEYASSLRPCFVLTNGTEPLLQRATQLQRLKQQPYATAFRVSLDYPDAQRHDAGRGPGSFAAALRGLKLLLNEGFDVSIARQQTAHEDSAAVELQFRELLAAQRIPALPFTAFPDFSTPGVALATPEITEGCMERYPSAESRSHFMCAYSRMLVKREGRMRVYACTLVDDSPAYDLGATLGESLAQRVMLGHHRCFSCYRFGASCSQPGH